MVVFVTAFLCTNFETWDRHRSIETYMRHFAALAALGVQLHAFIDSLFKESLPPLPPTTVVEFATLPEFALWKQIADNGPRTLPFPRNMEKDTPNFMVVQNLKPELVCRAAQKYPDATFAWVDFGIGHVVRSWESVGKCLRSLDRLDISSDTILMPGCPGHPLRHDTDALWTGPISWRFCGGFFIGGRAAIAALRDLVDEALASSPHLTWEVNVWHILEARGWKPHIYPGNHDDSIFPFINT